MKSFDELKEEKRKYLEDQIKEIEFKLYGFKSVIETDDIIDTGKIETDYIDTGDSESFIPNKGGILSSPKDELAEYKRELEHLDLSTLSYIVSLAEPNYLGKFENIDKLGLTEEEQKDIEGKTPEEVTEYIGNKFNMPITTKEKAEQDFKLASTFTTREEYEIYNWVKRFYSGQSRNMLCNGDIKYENALLKVSGIEPSSKKTFN